MSKPLKIAFIGARGVAGTYSGIETYYEEVGSRLADRGHHVTAYCRTHFTPAIDTYRGIHVRRLPAVRNKHLETISHSVLSTVDCLRHGFDIIQFHAIGSAPLALIPRLGGRVTVVSVRGLDWQRAKWGRFARSVLRFGEWASARCPNATIVVSQTLQQHYRQCHGADTTCIPNAVVPATHAPARQIGKFGLEPGKYILYAGRLSPEKGVDVLLEAMRPLPRRMKIALAGGSSYSDRYINRVRSLAWDEVVFLGSMNREIMRELFSNCYAYVLPSVMEGLSVSLLEALSYGCCIIATDIPENLEVVGNSALVFRPGDTATLSTHLSAIIEDPALAADLRSRAVERAAAQPDWDEITRRTEALYYQLLGASSVLATQPLSQNHRTRS
jgi:glycosyltransferase involved in cell wall biosynthesis